MTSLRMEREDRQRGTALIVAMVLLLVMTILGVSSMHTVKTEERMAANMQESVRSFEAAEAALSTAVGDPDSASLTSVVQGKTKLYDAGGWSAGANYTTTFIQHTDPPVGSGYSKRLFTAYHFETRAEGFSDATDPGEGSALVPKNNAAVTVLRGGMYQLAPRF